MSSDEDDDTDEDMGGDVDNNDDDNDDDDDVNADDDATGGEEGTNDDQLADSLAQGSQALFSSLDLSTPQTTPPESSEFGPIRNSRRIFSRRQPAPMPEPLMALHRRATAPAPVPSGRAATRSTTSDEPPPPPTSHNPGIVSESVT